MTRCASTPSTPLSRNFEKLSARFFDEVLNPVNRRQIYRDADRALRRYLAGLERYIQPGDFSGADRLDPPGPLGLFVNGYILHGWFRAWLRSQGVDPDVFAPIR